jgi:medium-chain acyl-[acyl-carrier-protein] hydrolase
MHMRRSDSTDRWVERSISTSPPQLRLFCFPYAGGGAAIFRNWADELAPNLEVCAIQLPGRERRFSEPALRRLNEAVEILVPVLRPYLDLPFVFFGHSMGALIAYEVARGILKTVGAEPRALFVSGRWAPHLPSRKRNLHGLPQDELIAEVKALNGTPLEVFQHEELVELLTPILRSDLELVETYTEAGGPVLSCPVIAMGGRQDPDVTPDDLAAWRKVTTGMFKTMLFQGDHFYINGERASLLQAMRRELAALTPE